MPLQETRQVQQEAQLSPMDRATRLSVETVRDVRLIAFDKSCSRRMQPVRPVECGFWKQLEFIRSEVGDLAGICKIGSPSCRRQWFPWLPTLVRLQRRQLITNFIHNFARNTDLIVDVG